MYSNFIFHHIGIATNDIKKTASLYDHFGYIKTIPIIDPIQKVRICFLRKETAPLIELVEPLGTESPVSKIIEKSGVTPYHTCYEVKDIELYIQMLKQHKFVPLFKPVPAIAFNNRLICFLYNKEFGLLELLQ